MKALEKNQQRFLGINGERFASEVYKQRGYRILDVNIFNRKGKRMGEIDFIALKGNEVVCVEVKTRKREMGKFGHVAESVNNEKKARLVKVINWLKAQQQEWANKVIRVDVCAVIWPDLDKKPEKVIIYANAIEDLY